MSAFFKKKSLGQHFLNNKRIAHRLVETGNIQSSDCVLEIGPGTGMLTRALLDAGTKVIAVETDGRAIKELEETFQKECESGQLKILYEDIKKSDIDLVVNSGSYKVVANIPYYLSGFLFEKLLTAEKQPFSITFLVQKEVAERIARSQKESLLSLSIKAYGIPHYIETVKAGNFSPPPKVNSAIIHIDQISKERFRELNEEIFFQILKSGFAARRKQLVGNLSSIVPREELLLIFQKLGFREDIRGEDMNIDEWFLLSREITKHCPHA